MSAVAENHAEALTNTVSLCMWLVNAGHLVITEHKLLVLSTKGGQGKSRLSLDSKC